MTQANAAQIFGQINWQFDIRHTHVFGQISSLFPNAICFRPSNWTTYALIFCQIIWPINGINIRNFINFL